MSNQSQIDDKALIALGATYSGEYFLNGVNLGASPSLALWRLSNPVWCKMNGVKR